jgi:thioredoxin reductase (NADPH)
MSNGQSDEFDTVLAAVGRKPDIAGLGMDAAGSVPVVLGPSGKILCTNEQTSVPHIYAIGDVVEGAPELTPVAVQAGRILARRLFASSSELMVYKNIATTVFTPLEFGTVGLNEEEAIAKYGAENIDVYMSSFKPLEWSIVHDYEELQCLAKVIVDKNSNDKVLGMHIAAPNAGEIIQGFAVAFRKGLYHKDLLETVGIHPTTAEELCGLEISKSSGKDTKKAGC